MSLLSSLPPSHRDSPICTSYSLLLTEDFSPCSPSPSPTLAVGLSVGILLILTLLGAVSFHYRGRAGAVLGRVGCRGKEEASLPQYQRTTSEEYWLSLARRAQAKPEPGARVPVTEL